MSQNKLKKTGPKKDRAIAGWRLIEKLGSGGNGDVWKVVNSSGNEYAMKFLRQIDDVTYERFKSEVHILSTVDIDGVIKIVESFIPQERSDEGIPWFVMPLAESFADYIRRKKALDVVADFVCLAKTLEKLHHKEISHRDIKPENLLYLNDRLFFTDFGLVKYPRKEKLTPQKRDVGAKFTMAPEMRRIARDADGKKADIYSFAKTLWIALTGESKGFDGQYVPNGILGLNKYHRGLYLTSLDELLVLSTDNDPSFRPSMEYFYEELEKWLRLNEDFEERNVTEWFELQKIIFPIGVPERTTWTNLESIVSVISELSKAHSLNHMFFPNGGGHTITEASIAYENGFIALHVGSKIAELLRPKKLTYESFGVDPSWDYFRLEAEPVKPTGIANAVSYDGIVEALTEIEPGEYVPYGAWDHGEYNGEELPDFARPVSRYLKGSFVFFCTTSIYNRLRGKYDAYSAGHNKMTEDEFREFIRSGAEYAAKLSKV